MGQRQGQFEKAVRMVIEISLKNDNSQVIGMTNKEEIIVRLCNDSQQNGKLMSVIRKERKSTE